MLVFGDNEEWGVSVDDGCLVFHPNLQESSDIKATHIWKEAWQFVIDNGGFDAIKEKALAAAD